MDPTTFNAANPQLDKIAEIADTHLASPDFHEVLVALTKALGERYNVAINLTVDVFDEEGERSLPLLNTGLSADLGGQPYRTWGDSSPHKYVRG